MSRLRHRAVVLAAVAGLLLSGCADAPAPPPEPVPVPHYRMPADHCARLRPDEIAAAAGLVIPDGYEGDRQEWQEHLAYASCGVTFETPDDRFDEIPTGRFLAFGRAVVEVYTEPGDAEHHYRQLHSNLERLAERNPTARVEPAQGWWDEGLLTRRIDELVLDPDYPGPREVSNVGFARSIRHHNLLLEVTLHSEAPTTDLDQIERLFTDITQEVADQVRAALELTTVTVTPTPPA